MVRGIYIKVTSVKLVAQNRREAERRITMLTQKDIRTNRSRHPKMAVEKIMAFMIEFPWLRRVSLNNIRQVYVQKAEEGLLDYLPQEYEGECDDENFYSGAYKEYITFLDVDGNKISDIFQQQIDAIQGRSRFETFKSLLKILFGPKPYEPYVHVPSYETAGTIRNKLRWLGKNVSKVHYIYSYLNPGLSIIIYKIPKDWSLEKMITEYDKTQENIIKENLATIQKEIKSL